MKAEASKLVLLLYDSAEHSVRQRYPILVPMVSANESDDWSVCVFARE